MKSDGYPTKELSRRGRYNWTKETPALEMANIRSAMENHFSKWKRTGANYSRLEHELQYLLDQIRDIQPCLVRGSFD